MNAPAHSIAGLMALVDGHTAYSRNGSKEDVQRNRDAIEAYARAAGVVPPEVLAAVERMCKPISDTRLEPSLRASSATGQADARCMALIRDYLADRPTIQAVEPEWSELSPAQAFTAGQVPQPLSPDAADDLYWRLHALSVMLESSDRIDGMEHRDAYPTILDAMNAIAAMRTE